MELKNHIQVQKEKEKKFAISRLRSRFRSSIHTYPDILTPQLFLCGFGFRPHVAGESAIRIRNFLNPLSRVEMFEYATNPQDRALALVVQKLDAIHRIIDHYPRDNSNGFPNTYPLESDLSGGWRDPAFKHLEPVLYREYSR